MALIPAYTEMSCHDYFKDKIIEHLSLPNDEFEKYETVKSDGWLRIYLPSYFNPDEIDKELLKLSNELNVDLLWSTSTWGLFIKKRSN